jgi:tetratricopeptide (TPR) repeat protein
MAQKIIRKNLKKNELSEAMGKTVDYVATHRKGVTESIAIAAGLGVLVGGFFVVQLYRNLRAGRELSAGLAALEAPLATDPAAASGGETFATAVLRDQAADVHLRKAASYGGTEPARAASVILAARGSKPAGSADAFAHAARDGRAEIAAAAEIDSARLLAAQGKAPEAIDRLKRAIEAPNATVPKDALLYTLGQIYESTGAASDARAAYQRIVNDYPGSPYRSDARQRGGAPQ